MLRINKLADYGTVVMSYLAKHPQQLCNARDIASHTHLSVPTVSKLLKRLTGAGLLSSMRGVSGGYRLQRPAVEITVAEIIYALDEYRGLTECSMHPNKCSLQSVCHIQGNWQLISQAIESALDSVSLETLAKPALSAVDFDRIKKLAIGVNRG
jgi:FeS assembly SUF system regulator